MGLGVDGMRTGRVVRQAALLTLGTFVFVLSLTLLYESMRSVMDIGGSCASGGPYQIAHPCPKGVGWVMPVSILGMLLGAGLSLLGVLPQGGPRPYAFAWSALFLTLGWNFLDDGFDAPGGGTSAGWLVCGFVFVAMGGAPLLFLVSPRAARWAVWGPSSERPDDHLHPYEPPPMRAPAPAPTPPAPTPPAPTPPAPTPPTATAPAGDVVARLATLADLRERGMLDDDEYERAKAAVLRAEPST